MNGNGLDTGVSPLALVTDSDVQEQVGALMAQVVGLAKQVHELRRAIPTRKQIEHLASARQRTVFKADFDEMCLMRSAVVRFLQGQLEQGVLSQTEYDDLMWR